ncbi:MAG TPA: serpin family protein [Anaerolineales bacterium]|nr:serpin family protein [Anaerolineales bacterium]
MNLAKSDLPRNASPEVPASDTRTLVRGNNAFALDIYRTLSTQDGNLILSPFSISLALAMTHAGAGGETESQMAETLHFDLPQHQLHPAFNALDQHLARRGEETSDEHEPLQLNIANAVWAEQTYPFLQEYLDQIAMNYGAGIRLADFIHQFEAVRQEINDWVLDQTEEKIRDLLPEGVLNPDTRMVLVNAIYFKADWLIQFDANSTLDSPFYLLDGSATSVPMMHKGMFVPYYQGDGFQAVELSYSGDTAAMDILVPDEGRFTEFEAGLSSAVLDETIAGMKPAAVNVALPRFTFESQFNLSDVLKSMGIVDAFEPGQADFSGMTAEKDLFISDVVHKAFVAVDEEGTEAAAATAVIIEAAGAPIYDITLTIDRPFIFIIRDKPSGQVLFIGRVLHPAQ